MNKPIEQIFVELIQKSLNLPENYGYDNQGNVIPSIVIKAQNIKLFNTPKLQITVSTASNRIYANRTEIYTNDTGELAERTIINEQRVMQIDVYSRNNEARDRFWEVQACLSSTLAEQLQEEYQFKIGAISNAFNLSGLDGGSDINRFTIRFNCLTWQAKTNDIDYYNNFRTTAQKQNDKYIADFTIERE